MLINGEKVYLYNPFDVKRWTDDEIEKEVSMLIREYDPEADTMYMIASNIEVLANINYLYGEMIARLTEDHAMSKLDVDVKEDQAFYKLRKSWVGDGKAPSIDYFKAQAREITKEDREKVMKKLEMISRFKYSYESYCEKINALKKKMDSIKYEEFGGVNG